MRGRRLSSGKVQIYLPSLEDYLLPPGWVFLQDAVRQYGAGTGVILRLIRKGQVRARKRDLRWQIEVISLARALKAREIPAGWVTTGEAATQVVPCLPLVGLIPGRLSPFLLWNELGRRGPATLRASRVHRSNLAASQAPRSTTGR